ncbi:MAG: DUF3997 domain-containing protein [Muribaculaceae bacterium]|nr:DUF3997 domain-containing protein [Muribaculaceae bacterium]
MIEKIKNSWIVRQFSGIHWIVWFFLCVIVLSSYEVLSWKFGGHHYYLWDYGDKYFYEKEVYRVVKECVPPYIYACASDSLFIIAEQHPKGLLNIQPVYYKNEITYPDGDDSAYYWIIDKTSHKVSGPFDLETFNAECDRLNINLKLRRI